MRQLFGCSILLVLCTALAAQDEPPVKFKTATIQWLGDTPVLAYEVRYNSDTTTMPTAFKYLLKDLADSEGWHLTGEDKSKTIASQVRRVAIAAVKSKSKVNPVRVTKIEAKETPMAVEFVVTFGKKPAEADVTRTAGVLETFARKLVKATKSVASTVQHEPTGKGAVWNYEVRFKETAAKPKK